jgi:hypothetical protein
MLLPLLAAVGWVGLLAFADVVFVAGALLFVAGRLTGVCRVLPLLLAALGRLGVFPFAEAGFAAGALLLAVGRLDVSVLSLASLVLSDFLRTRFS